ncbi:MAG TPA: DUF2231 domain-containing protein [Ignavibacteriaceae bacterium]|nr:DUF2231 domain-containing protein [Ignavibacteriaceae bacterium]
MEYLAGLHEKVTHFPIAFLAVYPIIELIAVLSKKEFFGKAAFLFLFIGVIGALMAVLTGNQAFTINDDWSKESLRIFNQHEINANITIWLFTALLIFRYFLSVKRKLSNLLHILILLTALTGLYFIYQTGNYGGELVKSKYRNSIIEEKTSDSL